MKGRPRKFSAGLFLDQFSRLLRGMRIALTEPFVFAFGKAVHEFVVKVVEPRSYLRLDTFFVHLARPVDRVAETVVKVVRLTSLDHLFLIVKLDLRNQQTCEPACV